MEAIERSRLAGALEAGITPVAGQGAGLLEQRQRLLGQRDRVLDPALHLWARNAPDSRVGVDLAHSAWRNSPGRTNSSADSFKAIWTTGLP